MVARKKKWIDKEPTRTVMFAIGVIVVLVSPVVGAIPGPGGVFVFAFGLALMLRTSRWARRQYVRFKRWQPEAGRWADLGLRRKSALRRRKARKQGKQDCVADASHIAEDVD